MNGVIAGRIAESHEVALANLMPDLDRLKSDLHDADNVEEISKIIDSLKFTVGVYYDMLKSDWRQLQ